MNQTGSYRLPLTIMRAIPLMVIGVMPGFWLLNQIGQHSIGGFRNPVFFSGPAFIGMIALAGIVTQEFDHHRGFHSTRAAARSFARRGDPR